MIKAKKKLHVNFADEQDDGWSDEEKNGKKSYNNMGNNGSFIENCSIPDELLLKILCYIDHKSLLGCQLVCKHWNFLIKDYVWQKKAELMVGKSLALDHKTPWTVHYFICDEKPFYKNLIKNHSGEHGPYKYWDVLENGGNGWTVERPPKGVRSLPNDPVFEDKYSCFVASFLKCWKEQVINLVQEGFSEYMLDHLQPTIKVSEWFCSHPDAPAQYECTIKLLREQKSDRTFIETLSYNKIIEGEQMNHWFKFSHEFKNYGKGLRKIKFGHGGQDRSLTASRNYGTKMAGACIKLEIRT